MRFSLEDLEKGEVMYRMAGDVNYDANTTDSFTYHATDGYDVSTRQQVDIIILVCYVMCLFGGILFL